MTIEQILELPRQQMRPHLQTLGDHYRQTTGRDICLTCWGDINFMITYLKNEQKMSTSKFKLKNDRAIYKFEKGSPRTLRAELMTDQDAIEYIKINPERITLFSVFPEDWRQLCGLVKEEVFPDDLPEHPEDDCCEEDEEAPCEECLTASLMKISLNDLKSQWKDTVKFDFGSTKEEYVAKIVQYKLENQ